MTEKSEADKPTAKVVDSTRKKTDPLSKQGAQKQAATAGQPQLAAVPNRGPGKPAGQQGGKQGGPGRQGRPAGQGPGQRKGQGSKQGQQQGRNPARKPGPPPPPTVTVQPLAQPASMKRRHWGLLLSFVLIVTLPLAGLAYYLWTQAKDQYSSTAAFTVRSEEGGSASELLGGLAQFANSGTGVDSDILYEFIQSQEIVETIEAKLALRAHYETHWPKDWMFSIWPNATLEDLVWFWQRIVRISYDQSTGLIEIRVLAFDPDYAQDVAQQIVSESQDRINALNIQAREDAMRYAREDLEEAVVQLKTAREALTSFRTRTRIVDPEADIQGRMGVMNNLQQALAEALIEFDLLSETVSTSDPRLTNAQRRIDVIRERIAAERQTFASDSTELGAVGEDYPSLIAEYESLSVDRQFAEETYRVALTALDVARDNAARQSRYLATYIRPTMAQSSEFPRRYILMGLAMLFLLMLWSILALIYYSIRDRG